jgi:hypothetical protein
VRTVAQEAAQRITRKVIIHLQRLTDTLSGDASELETTWDEICVQVETQKSIFWDTYDDIVRSTVGGFIAELPAYQREAIWLQTDSGIDWDYDDSKDRMLYPVDDDIINYVVERVYSEAADWSNRKIEAYKARQIETD